LPNPEPAPPLILGTGIDIIDVERIEQACEKFGDRFLQRILHPSEIEYCRSHKAPGPFLAARFAGKEAVSKAFGTGIGAKLGWQDMEIRRKPSGEPYVVLHGKGQALLDARGGRLVHLSLSHTATHAAAMAILESA
jgi:holo-[acyl-carrier protein] synthase